VLCLHDELLVHVSAESAVSVARLLDDCLQEAVRRWAPDGSVRFLADTAVVERWSAGKRHPEAEEATTSTNRQCRATTG
jgi:DNA polymerase-1